MSMARTLLITRIEGSYRITNISADFAVVEHEQYAPTPYDRFRFMSGTKERRNFVEAMPNYDALMSYIAAHHETTVIQSKLESAAVEKTQRRSATRRCSIC